jgi:hypothetical protein
LSLPVDSATLTDIKGLISADSTVVSDLQAFAGGNGAGSIVADVGRANAAVIIVRHDLGLPLPQS